MNTCTASKSWLLWIILLWTWVYFSALVLQFTTIPFASGSPALYLTINLTPFFPSWYGYYVIILLFPLTPSLPLHPTNRGTFLQAHQGATEVLLLTVNTEIPVANLFESGHFCFYLKNEILVTNYTNYKKKIETRFA